MLQPLGVKGKRWATRSGNLLRCAVVPPADGIHPLTVQSRSLAGLLYSPSLLSGVMYPLLPPRSRGVFIKLCNFLMESVLKTKHHEVWYRYIWNMEKISPKYNPKCFIRAKYNTLLTSYLWKRVIWQLKGCNKIQVSSPIPFIY